jgi:hypothetical protein
MNTASDISKVNQMSTAEACQVAKLMFGGTVYAARLKRSVEIRVSKGLCISTLGAGKSWVDAFRAAANTLGLVG